MTFSEPGESAEEYCRRALGAERFADVTSELRSLPRLKSRDEVLAVLGDLGAFAALHKASSPADLHDLETALVAIGRHIKIAKGALRRLSPGLPERTPRPAHVQPVWADIESAHAALTEWCGMLKGMLADERGAKRPGRRGQPWRASAERSLRGLGIAHPAARTLIAVALGEAPS